MDVSMQQTTFIFRDEDMLSKQEARNKQRAAYCLLLSVAMSAGKEDQDNHLSRPGLKMNGVLKRRKSTKQ
jgi:hypothetical protein